MMSGFLDACETSWQDVRYACRSLLRQRGFSLVAVLTLAFGIGASTAIFSAVNAVLLDPLPYRDAERLVQLVGHLPADESPTREPLRATIGLSVPELQDVRTRARTLSQAAISTIVFATWVAQDHSARLEGARVSPVLFDMLGARPAAGRTFAAETERPGGDNEIILSHAVWQRHFGGDPDVLGRTMTLEPAGLGNAFTNAPSRIYSVVGVMPATFDFPEGAQFWIPFAHDPAAARPARGGLLALLAPGAAPEAAAAELGTIVRSMRGHSPRVRYEVVREEEEVGAAVRAPLLVLTGAVALVLLMACVNVASLMLVRNAARHHELAVRAALGAGRGRLARYLLTESLLLAMVGGAGGVALAFGGIRLFRSLATTLQRVDLGVGIGFPRLDAIALDGRALVFSLAASIFTGLLFGVGPALRSSRTHHQQALSDRTSASASGGGSYRRRTQTVLVAVEMAMAVTLLVGAGLLVHSFTTLTGVDSGYDPANVLTFQVAMPQRPIAELARFSDELVTRLQTVPGVQAAAYARQLPVVQIQEGASFRRTPAVPAPPSPPGADARLVGGRYFETLGIRLLAGRALTDRDAAGQPRVVVINEALARRDFPAENPVGQQVYIGRDSVPWQVVGIVEDVRQFGPARPPDPQFFADIRQWPAPNEVFIGFLGPYYAVSTRTNTSEAAAAVERIVRQLQPNASLHNLAPLEQLVANVVARPRLYTVLLGLFAAIATGLAGIGIYGVVSYAVGGRTQEIGIRLALGATPARVLRLVLRQTTIVVAVGILAGLAGAFALTRYLEGMLFGVTPLDPLTFVAVPVAFALVACLAAYVPARRVVRIAPLQAMRSE